MNVKEQLSHLSEFSSPEDVKMLRVALFTERGRMLRILLGLQIIHSFVLHEECFYLEGRVVELAAS